MIRVSCRYFNLLYRRSGRVYFDGVAFAVFAAVFLVDTGKDYPSTFLTVGAFGVAYLVFVVMRQFGETWQREATAVVVRTAGRRGAFLGVLLSLGLTISLFMGALLLFSFLDRGLWQGPLAQGLLVSLLSMAMALVVAGAAALHFTPTFAGDAPFGGKGTALLGLVVVGLGMVSGFAEPFVASRWMFVMLQHLFPPINPLLAQAMYPRLSMAALVELLYAALYGAALLAWAYRRWLALDLCPRAGGL